MGDAFRTTRIDLTTEAEIPGIDDAAFQEQGNEWLSNPANGGVYFIRIAGNFQAAQATSNILVSILESVGITVTIEASPTPTPTPTPTPAPGGGGGGGTALPPVGDVMRPRTFRSVVFPAPLRPITPRISPGRASKETSLSAQRSKGRRFSAPPFFDSIV